MRNNQSSRNNKAGGGKPYKKEAGSNPRTGDKKTFRRGENDGKPFDKKKSWGDKDNRSDRPKKSFDGHDKNDRPKRFDEENKGKRSFGDKEKGREFDKKSSFEDRGSKDGYSKKSYDKRDKDTRPKRFEEDGKPKRNFGDKGNGKPRFVQPEENPFDKPYPLGTRKVSGPFRKQFEKEQQERVEKPYKGRKPKEEAPQEVKEMTLNKYIAHSGQCSRRDAAEMVKQGKVKVNGELALDPGYRVQPFDIVTIAGKKLTPQKGRVYILLNKPKGYITTTEDPEGRRTIMDLVDDIGHRLFPVGRLDRNTTGLILLTNDGDLAQNLSHPSYEIKKVYQATLDKPLTKAHFEQIVSGITLDDGEVHVDALAYLDEKNELGLEIHSGRNRIVRRIFESLGYEVEKLDRVMYAGLTKKNLPRGHWRQLEEKEVIMLKHFKS